ncbi:MAG: hypothetical protein J6S60_04070 [Oscillospiraceae bacterium]|nr:hypothetical protein [Oscillospiraceae bacterium]
MATSRVDLNGTTLIDISDTTAVAADVAQNKIFYTANGLKTWGAASGGMNTQVCISMDYVNTTSYTETDVTLTCAKAGTYTISWMGFRNTNSGTSGSALYINGTEHTAVTSFTRTYGQSITLTNISLQKDDVLTLYARARNTSYYMYVGNLIIQQTA